MRLHLPKCAGMVSLIALSLAQSASAVVSPAVGYAVKRLDGDYDLGLHFALAQISGDQRTGFFYVSDQQALFSASCAGAVCSINSKLTNLVDQGQFVSALALPGASNRPLVAYYDATNRDLRAGTCNNTQCNALGADRILDGGGEVGEHTSIALNPATGFAAISYYGATTGDARLYVCSNADCTDGSLSTIDAMNDVGKNGAIAFGANLANFTNLFAVYDDSTLGVVKLSRGVAPFTNFATIILGQGSDPAINVGASGFPDIVYRGPNDNLVHVRCLSFDCSGTNQVMQTLSDSGQGVAPSITRLPNGNAFMTAQLPSTGTLFGYVCANSACNNPQIVIMETGPGYGAPSVAASYADGRPLAFYQDAINKNLRAAECSSVGCNNVQRRISVNGIDVALPNLALRGDGRAVAVWLKSRRPMIGVCANVTCTSLQTRETGGFNTDTRPSIAIRPDGRPFVYYTAVGGTAAWDCNDTECATGTARFVSGDGNATAFISELALRSDGVPMMVYMSTVNSNNSLFVYACADINCTAGASRMLVTEANALLSGFSTEMRSDNRLIVSYLRFNIGDSSVVRRVALCGDASCSTSNVVNAGGNVGVTQGPSPMALRSNNLPSIVNPFFNSAAQLRLCFNDDCTDPGVAANLPFTFQNNISTMRLAPGNIPIFDAGSVGSGGFVACADNACSSSTAKTVITSTPAASANFFGRVQLDSLNQPALIFDETIGKDIWLAMPIPNLVFRNGFE